MTKAQRPVYGDAQKAQFMSGANDLANSSMASIRNMLARSGASDSGRMGALAENVGLSKMKNISDFMGQIPYLNEQARSGKVNNLLNSAMGWTGKAPTDTQSTGESSMESILKSLMSGSSTSQTTIQGQPWYKSLLGSAGQIANAIGGGMSFGGGSGSVRV